jgi:redox-sensing transcriptional repressor
VAGLLDADARVVGQRISGLTVEHIDKLETVVKDREVSIAVIATPASSAQAVCDRLVEAGVTSILNFAPVVLSVPQSVDVRKVDLSIELQILAFHEQRKAGGPMAEQFVAEYGSLRGGDPPGSAPYVEVVDA